jgi:hypothetical protein
MNVDSIAKNVQVFSVIAGVVFSVWSFNATRKSEAEARRIEASKPFLDLRQKLYMEAVKAAAVLATPDGRKEEELRTAKRRFRELYVAELSMVESPKVEAEMVELAKKVDPGLISLNPAQQAAYDLAHALRDSFAADWGVDSK